jgi:hypothetical protein
MVLEYHNGTRVPWYTYSSMCTYVMLCHNFLIGKGHTCALYTYTYHGSTIGTWSYMVRTIGTTLFHTRHNITSTYHNGSIWYVPTQWYVHHGTKKVPFGTYTCTMVRTMALVPPGTMVPRGMAPECLYFKSFLRYQVLEYRTYACTYVPWYSSTIMVHVYTIIGHQTCHGTTASTASHTEVARKGGIS